MKIFKNAILLNLIIMIIMGGAGFLSYRTYLAFQQYNIPQKNIKITDFLDKIILLIDSVNDERIKSTTYLTRHTKSKFIQVVETRNQVDEALSNLNKYIKENSTLSSYTIYVKEINRALYNVREEVDSLNNNYHKVLFQGYHSEVFKSFSNIFRELSLDQNSELIKDYLMMYHKMILLKENTILENTLIYYTLLINTPMDSKDIQFWNQIMIKDKLPNFDMLLDGTAAVDLNILLSPEEYEGILLKERKLILRDSKKGSYDVSVIEWLDKITEKTNYFTKAEKLFYSNIAKKSTNTVSKSKTLLISYAVGVFFLLLLLFKLLSIQVNQAKKKKLSDETRRDIELVFDDAQQKKLKSLIENGHMDFVYKFLIQAISDANQTKDLFLASMSHEIRTPLNGILGFTQLLKESKMSEEQHEFLLVIEKSSDHLLRIVNDILDLSKIKAQKIELEEIEFDPIVSFEAALESYATKAIEKNIEFSIFLDPKLPTLLIGDPTKISQVIVNLLSNAIKFTSENGDVSVTLDMLSDNEKETQMKFSVSDTGIGVTKEQQKKIFVAFSQADVSTSREYGGTGLGLSISGKLIDLMDSELKITSVKDKGSTFFFTLTLKKPKSATKRDVENMSAFTVGILSSHIENDYYINKGLESYIAYTGARIKRYSDETLLSITDKSEYPDILFIDYKYRHRGDEIEKFIDIDCKIILMSAGDQKRHLKQYESRIDKVMYKPVNFTKTIKALSNKKEIKEEKTEILFENIHVLVAEDNLINQKLIINVLNRIGIEVSIANNGKEALEHRMMEKYDMIFMDIEMPVMGGMEATGKILSYERHNSKKHTPIIALTANALSGDKEKYMAVGMDGYLSKPIELDTLRGVFQEYFEERIVK